jgi:hypothetical protein
MMTKGIVDDFQVIEIDDEQRPTARRRPRKFGKRGMIGCPVRVPGQCVGKRTPLMFEDALMSVYGDLRKMDAIGHHFAFECSRSSNVMVVESKGRDRAPVGIAYRTGPACAKPVRKG